MHIKYNTLGTGYNLTRKADKVLTENLLKHIKPLKSGLYLDIGCGTGNYTIEFQKRGYEIIGMDPSIKMLTKAQINNSRIEWKIGSAENIGLPNNYVDGIVASLTIHHWTDLHRAFSELYRVLKSNGNIVIFTSSPRQMNGYWLNHYFPKMLKDSITQMPEFQAVKNAMEESGFDIVGTDKYNIHPELEDKFLYCGKHNPELYFDKQIRNGISSFSALANKREVKRGLSKLREDINNEKIEEVIQSYKNDLGDYLYIIGKKSIAKK